MRNKLIYPKVTPVEERVDAELVRMIELYRTNTVKEVGVLMNKSGAGVFRRLKKAGVQLRARGEVVG